MKKQKNPLKSHINPDSGKEKMIRALEIERGR